MRTIILSLFIIMNIVAIIMTLSQPLTVNYFSLRVILIFFTFILSIFFTFILSIFFILIKSSRLNNILTILSIVLVIIHMGILAHSTYVYLY
ncbi:TPA: hypothetical protein SGD82_000239 [Staphylococcus aureus]|nr:hypothetical protein [Staphylococcus aureus]HEG9805736.1 hypothetical protein [Staphylococcus aureus]HEH9374321.1 hypothetical protein [Staphylococcus aureus]